MTLLSGMLRTVIAVFDPTIAENPKRRAVFFHGLTAPLNTENIASEAIATDFLSASSFGLDCKPHKRV